MTRADVLGELAGYLIGQDLGHPLRVGIDGWCGAGKTRFRMSLAERLREGTRPVVELDSDGFHNSRAVRYRRGRASGRGYYEDAYDFAALDRLVLRPLAPAGSRRIATKVHDLASDQPDLVEAVVEINAIVLFDCTFLQRGALRGRWDEVLYLDAEDAVARARGLARDVDALGGADAAAEAYERRYLAACRIYREEEHPEERASVLIDNTDVERPRVVRQPARA